MAVSARINLATTMVVATLASTLVVLAVLGVTPAQIGPVGVTSWFVAFFVATAAVLSLVIHILKKLVLKKAPGPNLKASIRQGSLISAWATVNLALSSLRQLSLRDNLLSAMLAILIEFYLRLK